jgi:3-ketosteroid 9alpha-monooxygenase subunit B
MKMAQSTLRDMGATERTIHQERFVGDFSGASALAGEHEEAHELLVEYGSKEMALRIRPGANILAGVLEAGIPATYGCASGICSTCMCQLISGSVDQASAVGLTQDEAAAGKILLCRSQASTAARLRIG